eukprot:COSAG01_NODE_41_length_32446_cov_41.218877_9_plen_250_part_00
MRRWVVGPFFNTVSHYSFDQQMCRGPLLTRATVVQPHRSRRREILQKHPEIKELFGHEWKTKYMVAATVLLQTFLAAAMRNQSWPVFLLTAYVVGATCNHSLFLAIHEWSHNLGFKRPVANQVGSMFANLPIGFPYSASFKPYHMDHHRNQGVDGLDTDIPAPIEASIISNRMPLKALYMLTQLVFYAMRPTLIKPLRVTKMLVSSPDVSCCRPVLLSLTQCTLARRLPTWCCKCAMTPPWFTLSAGTP